jgi:hypothetical protein
MRQQKPSGVQSAELAERAGGPHVNCIEHASSDANVTSQSSMRTPWKGSKVTSDSLFASEVDH